jgi:hypothetical protein
MAKVFPAPVSPVINQPRQKSFRFRVKPAKRAVTFRSCLPGALASETVRQTNNGAKLTQETRGNKNQIVAAKRLQRSNKLGEIRNQRRSIDRRRRSQLLAISTALVSEAVSVSLRRL